MVRDLLALTALCMVGLVACDSGAPTDPATPGAITLQLNRMEDGDLQYCDDGTGDCLDLPYEGQCEVVEVDIDPATGATCERCITASGEVIDLGCTDTSVGCVLVTLPEPDCVICAYVNGAIIFSTCVANDEPECTTDAECVGPDGRVGACVNGQCVYEGGCTSDADCGEGEVCELWCAELPVCDPTDPDCPPIPPPPCEGICVPYVPNPCDAIECAPGQHCEVQCLDTDPPCSDGDPNCGCRPVCVDDPTPCQSDADCGEGEVCELWCVEPPVCDSTDPDCPSIPPPTCEGICVPEGRLCASDADCPEGQVCGLVRDPATGMCGCDPSTGTCRIGVCIDGP